MARAFKTCSDLISQKKTYSIDINMLKIKPANENYQMLHDYEGQYEPRQNNIDFESARDILMNESDKTVVKRGFERISIMMHSKSYTNYEDISENKEIFFYGFKHVKRDKVGNYILIGCESNDLYENDKSFNFWSNKFINKKIEKKDFKITG